MKGQIIKSVSNLYTVYSSDKLYVLKARGLLKYKNEPLKVGDIVEFDNTIDKVLERRNSFLKPFISNVDYSLIVTSLKNPLINFELLDRFIVNSLYQNVTPILVFTKKDLLNEEEFKDLEESINYYKKYYNVFYSNKDGIENINDFKELLKNKTSFLCGQTGAGKSHLLNTLDPSLNLKTQEISDALNRGKHTTRNSEIYDVDRMFIADTPGFSSFELPNVDENEIKFYFVELNENINKCKYNECSHTHEPNCIVKDLVMKGEILKSRYDSYTKFYKELKEKEIKY